MYNVSGRGVSLPRAHVQKSGPVWGGVGVLTLFW